MKVSVIIVSLLAGYVSTLSVGDICSSGDEYGTCEHHSYCHQYNGQDDNVNLCPGTPDDVKCCFNPECYSPYTETGACEYTEKFNCHAVGGTYHAYAELFFFASLEPKLLHCSREFEKQLLTLRHNSAVSAQVEMTINAVLRMMLKAWILLSIERQYMGYGFTVSMIVAL
ncbi:hypothetical protein L207DRAFT_631983 [Hyaloscypha variabilis F]|uniref:Uncharacterized protein n=1 Tax=Hyaloscypha variabilis (strain UAMH 11265 / GT02V1 / F) TaxID=1149755 RepID=A0A2J6RUG1_HYAVF|nr:hypothetical protein L207DRAFT_631983 [Hyaloscypha variabilis F]